MSTAEPDVTVRPSPEARYCVGPGTFVSTTRPSTQIESLRTSVIVLHAASSPISDAGRRRPVARHQVVAQRGAGEQEVVGATGLGMGDDVEALGEDRHAGGDGEAADGDVDGALGAHHEPVVPRHRPRGEALLLAAGSWSSEMPPAGSSS